MRRLLREHPDIAVKLVIALGRRLREANERLARQSFQTVQSRVAAVLAHLVAAGPGRGRRRRATCCYASPRPTSPSSPAPRASRRAASSPSLERAGVIAQGRGRLTVHDPAALGATSTEPAEPSSRPAASSSADDAAASVIVPHDAPPTGDACSRCPRATPTATSRPPSGRAREVREEAGVEGRLVGRLGDVRYWYRRERPADRARRSRFYLLRVRRRRLADHDHEVEEARWMPLEEAARGADLPGRARDGRARAIAAARPTGRLRRAVQVLNFYSTIFADQLKRGRKTATIRLGDKSHKYRKNQAVLVTVGYQHSPREKIFDAVIDQVEVKRVKDLSPRDIEHDNPEFRRIEEMVHFLEQIYGTRGRRWTTP